MSNILFFSTGHNTAIVMLQVNSNDHVPSMWDQGDQNSDHWDNRHFALPFRIILSFQICLYEFLTGFPPYTDETVEKIFDNILSDSIEWPEGAEALSDQAKDCILGLLARDSTVRANLDSLKQHILFGVSFYVSNILFLHCVFVG